MTRRATAGLDVDTVEWQPMSDHLPGYPQHGAAMKVLSRDDDTGAFTALVKLPRGWGSATARGYLNCLVQQYLLEGALLVDGVEHTAPAYWCVPPGTIHGQGQPVTETAVSLMVLDGAPTVIRLSD